VQTFSAIALGVLVLTVALIVEAVANSALVGVLVFVVGMALLVLRHEVSGRSR
jgi:hypothetical protein